MIKRLPLLVLWVLVLAALALPGPVAAQQGMSADLHRQVQEINEIMTEGRNEEAARRLAVLRGRGNLNNYEKGVLSQLLGFAHAGAGKPREAIASFEDALGYESLPEQVRAGITTALVQMYLEVRDFDRAKSYVERVLAATADPDPDFLAVAAYVHYELGEYARAERLILGAIDAAETPPENWYQILIAIYRAQENWAGAEGVLREVIGRFPDKKTYWQYLSYVQFEQDKMHEALATLMLAWRLDLLEGEELERLAGLHGNIGIPEKAARLLEGWFDSGELEPNAERLSLAGRLWLLARERDRAKETLARAAEASDDGEIDLLVGRLHYEDEEWSGAMTHLRRALTGSDEAEARAEIQLLIGISAFHTAEREAARSALQAAAGHARFRDHARYWLGRLNEG